MPAMADFTALKADNVTGITYTVVTGSSGDNTDAIWRQSIGQPAAVPPSLFPHMYMKSKWNGPKTARVFDMRFVGPILVLNSTTGLYSASDRVVGSASLLVPQGAKTADVNEMINHALTGWASSIFKSSIQAGYAPR